MLSRKFTILTVIRIILLVLTISILTWIFGDSRLFFTQIILGIVVVVEVVELISFVNRTNRELSRFLIAIRHGDFSATFKQNNLGTSFNDLQQSMHSIMDAYKAVKIEKEAQYQLLQTLVQQISVGIIFLLDDKVEVINPTAQRLLHAEGVKDWKMILQLNADIADKIGQLGDNGRTLIEIRRARETKFVAITVGTQIVLERQSKLITLQDINSEIEQKEIEAWHKLIRILTHEIMNSITPISSLTETMQSMLTEKAGGQKAISSLSDETISDILFSLNTIHSRSEGLLNFVENYRKLTRVPKPQPEQVHVDQFISGIERLMADTLKKNQIEWIVTHDRGIIANFDPALMEQVVINLITNSIHALEKCNEKSITFKTYVSADELTFEVTDNGKGISEAELKEIFIPFFSTKKDGSGIGLSLSKQIISQHGGNIKVTSQPGSGTTFYVVLKQRK